MTALAAYRAGLPFAPDPFQEEAIAAIADGASVVVTAPTGAGKTVVAEAAVARALGAGLRAFYTTPLKALSNQKYADFGAQYGPERVGLLTGDNSINGGAPVVVMTTEVLRNMIYSESDALDGLGTVILDEVHYLQDRFRGMVWEEVIIHLPLGIPLVCLSATVSNAGEFTAWVASRRGDTRLVVEEHRPVPLESLYLVEDRHRGRQQLLWPIFTGESRPGRRSRGPRPNPRLEKLLQAGRSRRGRFRTPRRTEVAELLTGDGLLPAIYFIFSRQGCDAAAAEVAAAGLRFTDAAEAEEVRAFAEERTRHIGPAELDALGYADWVGVLERGIGAHHAGMVPAFKEVVEELFRRGPVKLVFATETLSLGINMPARTVVLSSLSKFTGESHELLQPGDYTQLTGRAGRRGLDTAGTAVVLHSRFVPFERVAAIAAAGSHPLESSYRPTFNMAVNLIANYPRARAEELLAASFGQFRADQHRERIDEQVADSRRELAELRQAAACDRGDIWDYLAGIGMDGAGRATHGAVMRAFARELTAGDVIDAAGGDRQVMLARGLGSNPRLLLLSRSGSLRRVRPSDLPRSAARVGTIALPEPFAPRDRGYQRQVVSLLGSFEPDDGEYLPAVAAGEDDDPVAACPDLAGHLEWARRARRVERDLRRLQTRRPGGSGLTDEFRSLLELLGEWGYVRGWSLTERGETLRFIYNESDLLVAEAVATGLFDGLTPAEFAALASLFVYDPRREALAGEWPTVAVAERGRLVHELEERLAAAAARRRLPEPRRVEPGFAATAHAWASGSDLDDVLDDDVAAGDFVRTCRQLIDLLAQIRDAFGSRADTASAARRAVDRGVVAAGGAG